MKVIVISGSIILPLMMVYIRIRWRKISTFFNVLMLVAVIIFGDIGALSVYQVIKDKTVFMTAIHAVFLDPFFLLTGFYIGIYTIYRLILLSLKERRERHNDYR